MKIHQAIEDPKQLYRLRDMLRSTPRDLFLFDMAIQTGLLLKDMVQLKVADLIPYQTGERVTLTAADNSLPAYSFSMSESLFQSFHEYLSASDLGLDDYLFKSRKGNGPLTYTSVSRLVQSWFDKAGITGLSGWSSLIKTWKYHYAHTSPQFVSKPVNPGEAPVQKKSIQETVYRRILQLIISGRMAPGQKIVTDQIARNFQVSETPVREALARLHTRGLIWLDNNKGYVVQQLSARDLEEIIKIRLNLETMAVTEACRKITGSEIAGLQSMATQFNNRPGDDIDEFYRFNTRFHSTVYRAARMPTLMGMIENLWEKMSPYFHLLSREIEEDDPRVGWHRHVRIIDGLKNKNVDYVVRHLQADISDYAYMIIDKMKNKEA